MSSVCNDLCSCLPTCTYERKQTWGRVTGLVLQIICLIGILALAKTGHLSHINTTAAACMLTGGFLFYLVVRYLRKPLHDDIRKEMTKAVLKWPGDRFGTRNPVSITFTFNIFPSEHALVQMRESHFVFSSKLFDRELSKLLDHSFAKLEGNCKAVYENGNVRITKYTVEMRDNQKRSKVEHQVYENEGLIPKP